MQMKSYILLLMLSSGVVHADVYKCKTAEGLVYSERPCDKGNSPAGIIASRAPLNSEVVAARDLNAKYLRDADISDLEREIQNYKLDKDHEIADLQGTLLTIKSQNPNVMSPGVEKHNANINRQIDSVTKRYDDKIADANRRLEQIKLKK